MSGDVIEEGKGYYYRHAGGNPSHAYLLPVLKAVISELGASETRAIDVGCGNGFVSGFMARLAPDLRVVGVEPSDDGIRIAREYYPAVQFYQRTAYEDLKGELGQFDLTLSFEVVEHLYSPKTFADTLFSLTKPGGVCLVSTPYHGYWKNLALALAGRLNHDPLYEGGHIKFFSERQLTTLLRRAGFHVRRIYRVGRRIPALAKSMVAVADRPK
jgi:2-polyprenyl-6-hydroxyphenyl methylase/3-demethylubiquinone-9 3-methyltransferase